MFLDSIVPFSPKTATTFELMDLLFYNWPKSDPKPPAAWRAMSGREEKKTGGEELTGVEIQLALAGFKEEDIKVAAEGRQIVVKGDNTRREDVDGKWKAKFSKKFSLQERLDIRQAEVSFFDGILSIKVPLKEKEQRSIPLFGE